MYYSKNFWTKLKYRKKHQGRKNESVSPDSEFPSWKRNKCLNRDVEHLWQAINEEKFTSSFDNHTPSDFAVATGLWRNRYWAIRCTISKLRFHLSNRLNEKNKKTKKQKNDELSSPSALFLPGLDELVKLLHFFLGVSVLIPLFTISVTAQTTNTAAQKRRGVQADLLILIHGSV